MRPGSDGPDQGRSTAAAFVTGAGSGIGHASALALSEEGIPVGAFDLDGEAAAATAAEIGSRGGRALALAGDVREERSVAAAVEATVEEFGSLTRAVSCAGVEVTGSVVDLTLEDWERAIAVNQTGTMLTARQTIPRMLDAGGGAFVAIGSDAGVLGAADWTPYCATKHAVIGIVRCLAMDFAGRGIRANVVCPSFVETPMTERIFAELEDDERRYWEHRIPAGRFASPGEVAGVVCHLLSPQASFTNGHIYMVDGGETAGLA